MNESPRKRHELKCWPEFFEATLQGIKRFELRRDDRGGFQVGDELLLKEWVSENRPDLVPPTGYTGREVLVRVDYIMEARIVDQLMGFVDSHDPKFGPNMVIMSVSLVN